MYLGVMGDFSVGGAEGQSKVQALGGGAKKSKVVGMGERQREARRGAAGRGEEVYKKMAVMGEEVQW